jgi:hypothetical protein
VEATLADHDFAGAARLAEEALALDRQMMARTPSDTQWKWYLQDIYRLAAEALLGLGRFDDALERARAIEPVVTELLSVAPDRLDYVEKRAVGRAVVGTILEKRGGLVEAVKAFTAASDDLDEVARRGGYGGEWLLHGPQTARDLARLLVKTGDREGARARLGRAIAALEELDNDGHLPAQPREVLVGLRGDLAALPPPGQGP